MFRNIVNLSSEYIPDMQVMRVIPKHHIPKNFATAWLFANLYSAGNLSMDFLNARYATNTHKYLNGVKYGNSDFNSLYEEFKKNFIDYLINV